MSIPNRPINNFLIMTAAYLKATLLELVEISERTYRRAILSYLKKNNPETTAHCGHTVEAACFG
jgi:hypothetical protein